MHGNVLRGIGKSALGRLFGLIQVIAAVALQDLVSDLCLRAVLAAPLALPALELVPWPVTLMA